MQCSICNEECGEGTIGVNVGNGWTLYDEDGCPGGGTHIAVTCGDKTCAKTAREKIMRAMQ